MNIFAISSNPYECAIALDDKRVVKMCLETAQLLSNCHEPGPYKKTHANHPVAKWVNRSYSNYTWTWNLLTHLLGEYTYRYKKKHKCSEYLSWLYTIPINSVPIKIEDKVFCQCTPGFEHITDVHEAYKQYLIHKWDNDVRVPKWTNRKQPNWYVRHDKWTQIKGQ